MLIVVRGSQWTPVGISTRIYFVHSPHMIFFKGLTSEVAKCSDTTLVWNSKQNLAGNTGGSYDIDWEAIKTVAFER